MSIEVNAIKFVGRILAVTPNTFLKKILKPLLSVLLESLGLDDSMVLLSNYSYTKDEISYNPFAVLKEDYDAGIWDDIEGLSSEAIFQLRLIYERRGPQQTRNNLMRCNSSLSDPFNLFADYLKKYIEEYVKMNEARTSKTKMGNSLVSFANMFDLQPYEVELLWLLAVIRDIPTANNCFNSHLKIFSKKQRDLLAVVLGSDEPGEHILQRDDLFNLMMLTKYE